MFNKIVWYDNDGNGNFGSQHLIDYESHPTDVCAEDLDNDGDMDIIATDDDTSLSWFENNGFGEFGEQIIISNVSNRSVYSADLNGDSKKEIITASFYENKVSWYENMGVVSVGQNLTNDFSIYPNPTDGIISIEINSDINKIEIYSNLGQKLLSNMKTNRIDISNLKKGLYYIKIIDANDNYAIRKIMKK